MVGVPAERPVTTPVLLPTVALAVLLLLHEPPDVASLREIVDPVQTTEGPDMDAGLVITDTVRVA